MDVICVVLGCDTKNFRASDSTYLINYAFENFEYVNIDDLINAKFDIWKKEHKNYFYIEKGISSELDISISKISTPIIPIKKAEIVSLKVDFEISNYLYAPIYKDTNIGTFKLYSTNEFIMEGNIIANQNIYKKSTLNYLKDFFINFSNILNNIPSNIK